MDAESTPSSLQYQDKASRSVHSSEIVRRGFQFGRGAIWVRRLEGPLSQHRIEDDGNGTGMQSQMKSGGSNHQCESIESRIYVDPWVRKV